MGVENVGRTIAELRRRNRLTQRELAERLGISDRTVSKWERGEGFPDIAILPSLAEVFGVTLDHLLLGEEKGITVAGNIILDLVKNIAVYPEPGMLADIAEIEPSVGGCAPNTAINLARIDRRIPLSVIGRVGTDENGRWIVSRLQKEGIDVGGISYSTTQPTGFCDVMSVPGGERTFFHKRGANAEFSPTDISLESLNCSLLHIGYILLLDRFDEEDRQYGTVMARFLHDVRKRGIKTSIDVVSDSTGDFPKKVIPALRYCNYVIINEIECCSIWGLQPRTESGRLDRVAIRQAMKKTMAEGVRDRVIVHCKEACFALDAKGNFTEVLSLNVPKADIKGTVGAGDAFCAGCLFGIYNNYTDQQLLEFASAAAACSLLEANAVDGMRNRNDVQQLAKKYGRISQ